MSVPSPDPKPFIRVLNRSVENKMFNLIQNLTPESLRDFMQAAGFRAELVSDPAGLQVLRSATSGMNFDIRFGNKLPGDQQEYADITLLALFAVEGELPLAPLNEWNNARRFGRLHLNQKFLLLDMDVSVTGGVTPNYLRAQIEIWDQLLQALVNYLRTELPKITANGQANVESSPTVTPAAEQQPAELQT